MQTPPGNTQFQVHDTDMYRSYQEAVAAAAAPQASHDVPMTFECYRPSPKSAYQTMYDFDLFDGTSLSAFPKVYIDPSTFDQQHHDENQDQH